MSVPSVVPLLEYSLGTERDIWVREWGDLEAPRTMLYLHGVGGNGAQWNSLIRELQDGALPLARHVSIDQRGHGNSQGGGDDLSPEAFVQDVVDVVETLRLERVTLVGHSRGGWIAAYAAGLHPGRFEKVVLVDPARLSFDTDEDHQGFYDRVRAGLGPFASIEAALEWGHAQEVGSIWTRDRDLALLQGLRVEKDGTLVGKVSQSTLTKLGEVRPRASENQVTAVLGDVNAGVLLCVASKSSQERQAQKLRYAELIPAVHVEHFDSTHYISYDRCAELARAIETFSFRS